MCYTKAISMSMLPPLQGGTNPMPENIETAWNIEHKLQAQKCVSRAIKSDFSSLTFIHLYTEFNICFLKHTTISIISYKRIDGQYGSY